MVIRKNIPGLTSSWLTPPVSVDKLYAIKTPTVTKTVNPSWKGQSNCAWKLVVAPKDTLFFEMWDDDRWRDDFLCVLVFIVTDVKRGEIRITGHDLIAKGEGEHWLPLRERGGKPVGVTGDVCIHLTIKP